MIRYEFDEKLNFLATCRIVAKLSDTLLPNYADSDIKSGFNKEGNCALFNKDGSYTSDTSYTIVFETLFDDVAKKVILKNDVISFDGFTPQEACKLYGELCCVINN